MPEIEINELPVGVDITTSSILHSKDSSGADVQITIGSVLDLASTVDLSTLIPTTEGSVDTGSDFALFSDATAGGEIKRVSFSTFTSALGLPSVTGSASLGYYNIGDLQIRYGQVVNNTDAAQTFTFATPFTTACVITLAAVSEAEGTKPISAVSWTSTGFTVDRDNGQFSPSNQNIVYIAMGY